MTCTATEYFKTLPFLIDLENQAADAPGGASALVGATFVTVKTTHQGRRHQYRINNTVMAAARAIEAINAAFDAIAPTTDADIAAVKAAQVDTIRAKWSASMDKAPSNMHRANAHRIAREALQAIPGTQTKDAQDMVHAWRQARAKAEHAAILARIKDKQDAANVRADDFEVTYSTEGAYTRATIADAQGNSYTYTSKPLCGSDEPAAAFSLRMALEQVDGIDRATAYQARDYVRPAKTAEQIARDEAANQAAVLAYRIERANDSYKSGTMEAADMPPPLAILATYRDNEANTCAQVLEQAGRYLVRLVDEDANAVVGIRHMPSLTSATEYAQRCMTPPDLTQAQRDELATLQEDWRNGPGITTAQLDRMHALQGYIAE